MGALANFIGWMLAILIGLFALVVLYRIYTGAIDLKYLLCESTNTDKPVASLARFQFLIFTFVIALCLFLVTVSKGDFPTISGSVVALLGISGGSYVIGKGIQAGSDSSSKGSN